MTTRLSTKREKTCNLCGEDVLVFTIYENAPLCNDCVPMPRPLKTIMNESSMLNKILIGSM